MISRTSSASTSALLTALLAASQGSAHMKMVFPAPLLSPDNPNTGNSGKADYSYTSPLSASGSDYPCKGHLTALGTPAGASVATFTAGQKHNFTVTGGANHNGGSCQASLSYDQGKTFTVMQSYEGGCPPTGTSSWDFTVPADAAAGEALFAWTWLNAVGNREMYMNCAAVTIAAAGTSSKELVTRAVAFDSRPGLFIANIGNGCHTPEGFQYQFPDPGPDRSTSSAAGAKFTQLACGPLVSSSASAPEPATTTTPAVVTISPSPETNSTSETTPGAVFITIPPLSGPSNATATSAPGSGNDASTPTSTTLETSTALASPAASIAASTTAAASAPVGTGSSSSPAAGTFPPGTKCANEGDWNCLGTGTAFQRCASGAWSVVMPMAQGTSCQPGVSSTLTFARRALLVRGGRWVPWAGEVGFGV